MNFHAALTFTLRRYMAWVILLAGFLVPMTWPSIASASVDSCMHFNGAPNNGDYTGLVLNDASSCVGKVVVPEGVVQIGNYTAYGSNSVTSVYIPRTVTRIETNAFVGYSHLYTVTFETNSGLTSIGDQAFYSTNIHVITFPSSLLSVGSSIFVSTPIESVTFSGQMPTVGGDFKGVPGGTAYFQNDSSFGSYHIGENWFNLTLSTGVGPSAPIPTLTMQTPGETITGTKNVPLTPYNLVVTSSDPDTVTVISGSLPSGIVVDTVTGQISGTPLESGNFNPTIQVTDEYGTSSLAVPIHIAEQFVQTANIIKIDRARNPKYFSSVGNLTYFIADSDDFGWTVWVTDGTDTGTRVVGETGTAAYVSPSWLTPWNNGVAFVASDPNNGMQASIFVIQPGVETASAISSFGPPSINESLLASFQGHLFYRNSSGFIRSVDGDGNVFTTDIARYAFEFTPVGERLYYLDGSNITLKYFDSNTGTSASVTAAPGSNNGLPTFVENSISHLTLLNGNLLFAAIDSDGLAIWKLNSTTNALTKLTSADIYDYSIPDYGTSVIRCDDPGFCPLSIHNEEIYFTINGQLWVTDSSTTSYLLDVGQSNYGLLGTWVGNKFYFASNLGDFRGNELQEFDPSTNSVTPISDLWAGSSGARIEEFGASGGALLFSGNDGSGSTLWIYGDAGLGNSDQSQNNQQQQQNNNQQQQNISPAPVPVPDPVQQSKISSVSPETVTAGVQTSVTLSGTFIERVVVIQINGAAIASGAWTQSPNALSFPLAAQEPGAYTIQLFNGAAPVLATQFTVAKAVSVVAPAAPAIDTATSTASNTKPADTSTVAPVKPVAPKPTSSSTPAPTKKPVIPKVQPPVKSMTITCVHGKSIKSIKGASPKCPSGYVKK